VLPSVEAELIELMISGGPNAATEATDAFLARLRQEAKRIKGHDSLDGVEAALSDTALDAADSDTPFADNLVSWLEGVGCSVRGVRHGVVSLRPRGRIQLPFDLEMVFTQYANQSIALSRAGSVAQKVPILRAGHPLLDALAEHLTHSDRGVAFAMFRHASNVWPPVLVRRSEVLETVDRSGLNVQPELPQALRQRVLELCAEHLPPKLWNVAILPNGESVDHRSVMRPYDRTSGDVNLGSLPSLFEQLCAEVDWEGLCRSGATLALDLVRKGAETDERADRLRRIELCLRTEIDRRKTRFREGLSGTPWELSATSFKDLMEALGTPRLRVLGAGAIFLADRRRVMPS
jgi:ATP-dependent helicase HepA